MAQTQTPPTIGDRLTPNPFWPATIDRAYEICRAAYLVYRCADDRHAGLVNPDPTSDPLDDPWRLVAFQAHDLWQAAEAAAAPLVAAWQRSRSLPQPVAGIATADEREAPHGH